jgi:hypothetical protein
MSCNGCGIGDGRYAQPFANTSVQGVWETRGRSAFPFANIDLQGMPNTVRAPRTPLYQLGWLGDDSAPDFTDFGPPVDSPILGPVDVSLSYPPSPDQTPSYQDMLSNPNLIPTTPTAGTGVPMGPVPSGAATSATASLTSALTSLFSPKPASSLLPGPSPRVSTLAPTISLGSALPMLAIGAVGIVLLTSLGGRRRRR